MTQTAKTKSFTLPVYRHSFAHLDTERHALWHHLNPEPRPVFSRVVLSEILDVQERVSSDGVEREGGVSCRVREDFEGESFLGLEVG